jgi:hypothetical protein
MEPPAYATFEEIRVEAWMQMMRAEVCEALRVAPDLAIPSRLLKSMTAAYLARGPDGLDQCLVGFRRELLLSSLQKYCRDRPPRT